MLKDRFFYPLAALIAAGMVIFAMSFAKNTTLSNCEIWEDGYVMSGEDLTRLAVQPGTQAEFMASSGGQPAFARLTSTVARASVHPKPGIFAPLGPEYERAFATRRLKLTITARSSAINGLDHFDMAYFSDGSGDTEWIPKPLTADWEEHSFQFRPGALSERRGLDHFSMWPGETAELLTMDVREMRVDVLDAPSCQTK